MRNENRISERPAHFYVAGVTKDVTQCGHCFREDLKSTTIIRTFDIRDNEIEEIHLGSGCAAAWVSEYFGTPKHQAAKSIAKHLQVQHGNDYRRLQELTHILSDDPIRTARSQYSTEYPDMDTRPNFYEYTFKTITGWINEYRKVVSRCVAEEGKKKGWNFKIGKDMETLFATAWAPHDEKMTRFGRNRQGQKI